MHNNSLTVYVTHNDEQEFIIYVSFYYVDSRRTKEKFKRLEFDLNLKLNFFQNEFKRIQAPKLR